MADPRRRTRGWLALVASAACAALVCSDSAPQPQSPEPAPDAPAPELPTAPAREPRPIEPPRESPAPEAPAAEPAPTADAAISLDELGRRIKETSVIGPFTKLALKNDIDDLLAALRRYHDRGEGRLDPLRERYEALVLKLLTLLDGKEPELALALARSRAEIWSRLADPIAFAQLSS